MLTFTFYKATKETPTVHHQRAREKRYYGVCMSQSEKVKTLYFPKGKKSKEKDDGK